MQQICGEPAKLNQKGAEMPPQTGLPAFFEIDWSTLPIPQDDGATNHLLGTRVPSLQLPTTNGDTVDLSAIPGRCVVYCYPMTGKPGTPLPDGWDMVPGARGCTPQSCSFRDHAEELKQLGVDRIFGLSTQDTAYQREAAVRLHLPFSLVSDQDFVLARAIELPAFETSGMVLLKRLTMIIRDGVVEKVFYPVFPPDRNALDVINWLTANSA